MISGEKLCNLCDRSIEFIENFKTDEYNRIVIGSYTCLNYLKYLAEDAGDVKNVQYDIVIPVISQMQSNILNDSSMIGLFKQAHSVVINDYGMLDYFNEKGLGEKIRLGRCFVKDYRDFRYPEYDHSYHKGYIKTQIDVLRRLGYAINSIETDIISSDYDLSTLYDCDIYYHYPFRMVSLSHICEFASIGKDIEKKFIPDDTCSFQCQKHYYLGNGLYKMGRGLYDLLSEEYLTQFNDSINLIIFPR